MSCKKRGTRWLVADHLVLHTHGAFPAIKDRILICWEFTNFKTPDMRNSPDVLPCEVVYHRILHYLHVISIIIYIFIHIYIYGSSKHTKIITWFTTSFLAMQHPHHHALSKRRKIGIFRCHLGISKSNGSQLTKSNFAEVPYIATWLTRRGCDKGNRTTGDCLCVIRCVS